MRILFIGDIVGRSGRDIVSSLLPRLRTEYRPDFVVANGENAAHGKGITPRIFHELLASGIDCITMGNHTYAKDNIMDIIDDPHLIRPLNLKPLDRGQGLRYYEVDGIKLGVISIMGRVFMDREVDDPYAEVSELFRKDAVYLVDFHGETTSEKAIFAHYYQHQVCAVLGTHTHVQTADERLIGGCAFISDVGMCGAYDSIIGRDIDEVVAGMIRKEKTHYTIAGGPAIFCGVVVDIIDQRAVAIKRIQIRPDI